MKVNREQFLAAAFLFASTTGCGKIADQMKTHIGAEPDQAQSQPVQGAGLGIDPNTVNNTPSQPTGFNGVTKNNPVNAKQPAPPTPKIAQKSNGPSSENIAPSSENIAPSKENIAPSRENLGPSREARGPSNEVWNPVKEQWEPRRRGGPSDEVWNPTKEVWERRGSSPRPTPSGSGRTPPPPRKR